MSITQHPPSQGQGQPQSSANTQMEEVCNLVERVESVGKCLQGLHYFCNIGVMSTAMIKALYFLASQPDAGLNILFPTAASIAAFSLFNTQVFRWAKTRLRQEINQTGDRLDTTHKALITPLRETFEHEISTATHPIETNDFRDFLNIRSSSYDLPYKIATAVFLISYPPMAPALFLYYTSDKEGRQSALLTQRAQGCKDHIRKLLAPTPGPY